MALLLASSQAELWPTARHVGVGSHLTPQWAAVWQDSIEAGRAQSLAGQETRLQLPQLKLPSLRVLDRI
jgi:hypothetical protein